MAKNSFQFDVTLGKNNYIPIGEVKQSDTMDFSIRVLENDVVKNLTGDTCTLYVSKQDGTILEQKEGINITGATSGTLTIRVKNQATACPGMTFFELEFKGADGIATSGTFLFTVNARVASGEAIQSKDEIQALEQVEQYVKEAKAELQKFKELQAAMLETNNSINNQEERRVEAERLRAEAEKGRVAAETKREEFFNKVEGRITANTEELEEARTATSGENFNSLDERIDAEVNRINKKIEISFLEQEDSEIYNIENTVDGMTKDMIVKGKTLRNHDDYCNKFPGGLTLNTGAKTIENKTIKANVGYTFIFTIGDYVGNNNRGGYVYELVYTDGTNKRIYDVQSWNGEKGEKVIFFTPPKDVASIVSWNRSEEGSILISNIMVLEGNWTDKKIPAYFTGIKSFGQENNEVTAFSCGKNFFNVNDFAERLNSKGELEFKAEGNSRINSYVIIFTENSTTSKSILVAGGVEGKQFKTLNKEEYYIHIGLNGDKKDDKLFKKILLPKNTTCFFSANNIVVENNNTVKFKDIQIEIGTSKTTFHNYAEDKKNIGLSKYGFNEGLRGIKTIEDELNSITNNAIKKIEKYIFTGNENWGMGPQGSDSMLFYAPKPGIKKATKNILCNKFTNGSNLWDNPESGEGITLDSGINVMIRIKKTKLRTQNVEGFKGWLRENETIIYYELENPIKTPLTENLNLKTFDEKTYVSFENSISGTSSFKVPVNAAATISRLNRENKALEEENLRLKKGTYKNSEDIILTNEELQITQSAVDHLLFGAVGTAMLYNGKKKGGGSMGAYLAMRIIKGKLKYDAVMKQYGEFKEDIDMILKAEGCGHLITQQ